MPRPLSRRPREKKLVCLELFPFQAYSLDALNLTIPHVPSRQ